MPLAQHIDEQHLNSIYENKKTVTKHSDWGDNKDRMGYLAIYALWKDEIW